MTSHKWYGTVLATALLFFGPAFGRASVLIHISLAEQRMLVYQGAQQLYDWPVSTARGHHVTPVGTYNPLALIRNAYSRKYHAHMPHAIFFKKEHGSYEYGIHAATRRGIPHLGHPASHGCVRLLPANATALYTLVGSTLKEQGPTSVSIVIEK